MPAEWYAPERSTCPLWVGMQLARFGGRARITRSPHFAYLFRTLWSPDGVEFYSYVPRRPLHRNTPWYKVIKHALWFEGRVCKVKIQTRRMKMADLEIEVVGSPHRKSHGAVKHLGHGIVHTLKLNKEKGNHIIVRHKGVQLGTFRLTESLDSAAGNFQINLDDGVED